VPASGVPGTGFRSGGVVPRRTRAGLWSRLVLILPGEDHVRPHRTRPGRPGLGSLVLFVVVQGRFTPALIRKRINLPG
jgi:hypothetical protein